ncbi:MAG: DNA repair protein RecN [Bacillota bacterium]|nr:DNA repair protein RecN [Bacillota bacterium]
MLLELNIKNFIIIDQINVKFDQRLNVITGETGAGKSIIIEAINLALGKKIKNATQKIKGDKAIIELIFDVDPKKINLTVIDDELIDDGIFVVTREIYPNGKSISRLNGKIISQGNLLQLTNQLIDVHGQHKHQSLLDEKTHLKTIDAFGYKEIESNLNAVKKSSDKYFEILENINLIINNETNFDIDYLKFQYKEIESANINIAEDNEIEDKFNQLSHLEDIINNLQESSLLIDSENGILNQLVMVKTDLNKISNYDSNIYDVLNRIESLVIESSDISSEINHLLTAYDFDENEFERIENRFSELNLLMKKYGNSLESIIEYKDDIQEKLDRVSKKETILKEYQEEMENIYKEYIRESTELSIQRKEVSEVFKNKIKAEISELNLKDIIFESDFKEKRNDDNIRVTKNGYDDLRFLLSTNKGMKPMPLKEIASGGEISRIMLGIKIVLSEIDEIDTMIFDEIDTGISGETAFKVGKKMVELSKRKQIIAITHLPQIAAAADRNFKIEKLEGLSQLIPLNENEKTNEVARIISGSIVDKHALKNSKSLIDQIKKI